MEIARVERLLSRHGERALRRLFHEEEVAYALARQNPFPSLAARLAAKEAFQKCWPESLSWKEVWVGMEGKRPALRFAPRIEARMAEEGLFAHLSLSHERSHALAVVVLGLGHEAEDEGVAVDLSPSRRQSPRTMFQSTKAKRARAKGYTTTIPTTVRARRKSPSP